MANSLDGWKFTTQLTNFQCDDTLLYGCDPAGSACARDPQTVRTFCCDQTDVCWADIAVADSTTFKCQGKTATWDCIAGRERCDQSRDNACLSTLNNLLNDISRSTLNETYTSLSLAQPSATYLYFDAVALAAVASSISTSSMTSATSTPTTQSTSTTSAQDTISQSAFSTSSSATTNTAIAGEASNTSTPQVNHNNGLSGGAIGGIVVGGVAGISVLVLGIWFLARRRRQGRHSTTVTHDTKTDTGIPEQQPVQPPPELATGHMAAELRGTPYVPELPAYESHRT
ncbi:hypothetical protein LTR84_002990 [Exophiala bonariae]|uniref:Mid2 domain-containing protein n=1 Tax=Exophiala bonariae TaxID=1690606 RepID=A0AAV9N7E4_9EURO|nr:hypothetical protein LTR84_002990 [Exophiala bonariae]